MGAGCCGSKSKVESPKPRPIQARKPSPVFGPDNSAIERSLKVDFSTDNPLKLIDGYQDEPLGSLEDALRPFHNEINDLSSHIQDAKTRCRQPSEHNLTRDESAAIYIYTMKWQPQCVYDRLHEAWNSRDRSQLKPWFKYLRLFKNALDKLPRANQEIWQGTFLDENILKQLESDTLPLYTSLGSCVPSSDLIKNYLKKNSVNQIMLFGYEDIYARSIGDYSTNKSKEYVVWPGTKVSVAHYNTDDATGSITLHMKGQNSK